MVDFGTATNIDVIDEDGYYIGGAIAPGIRISMDALAARAAKLASVPLEAPEHAIGRDTEECIKVGAVMGAAAMAEGLVARMKRELGREDATVIATGGLAGHRRRFDRMPSTWSTDNSPSRVSAKSTTACRSWGKTGA